MTEQEIKKLSRQELISIVLRLEKEKQELENEIGKLCDENAELSAKLENRQIELDEAGSIAEAAMRLNRVFEAAEAAAEQYIDSARAMAERQEQFSRRLMEESKRKARTMLEDAVRHRDSIKSEADCYWDEMSGKLERFYEDHKGLRELLKLETTNE